jgi:hypothetical protein
MADNPFTIELVQQADYRFEVPLKFRLAITSLTRLAHSSRLPFACV